MEKLNITAIATIILISLFSLNSHAQVAFNFSEIASADNLASASAHHSATTSSTNAKAEKNFTTNYQSASGTDWTTLADKSLFCRFYMNEIKYRAFYTPHGQWKYTISDYSGNSLDKNLSNQIKKAFYHSSIVFVNQVDMADGKTVYVVEIHDENSIKKLRVEGDEIEVVQEFKK
jgi:membrane-associated HD superfamily phosphohydrolase